MADEFVEKHSPVGTPADRSVETAGRDRAIIEAAIRGARIWELAEKHRLSERQVSRILRDAVTTVRDGATELVAEVYFKQHERLERLYRLVEMELYAYEQYMLAVQAAGGAASGLKPVQFDDRPFRVAVAIFERQARLHGIDRALDRTGPVGWLTDAPIEQVANFAKQLGMKLPTTFET